MGEQIISWIVVFEIVMISYSELINDNILICGVEVDSPA